MRISEIIKPRTEDAGFSTSRTGTQARLNAPTEYQTLMALLYNAFTPDGRVKRLWHLGPDPLAPDLIASEEEEQRGCVEPSGPGAAPDME